MLKINCFTTSYNRPYNLFHTINNILHQDHQDLIYSVVINTNHPDEHESYDKLLKDYTSDSRLRIHYFNNANQHTNYSRALNYCDHEDSSIYIKIDDDDIYHKNYVSKINNIFEELDTDILSFDSYMNINNGTIKRSRMNSIGNWVRDNHNIQFGMPPTYVFNHRAKKIIDNISDNDIKQYTFEDMVWREQWRQNNLRSVVLKEDVFIYNIHQHNTSSKFLLDKFDKYESIITDHCDINMFKHPHWQSYVIINKRNNRVYNINNNDHGHYVIKDDIITIDWNAWSAENFRRITKNNIVYYEYL